MVSPTSKLAVSNVAPGAGEAELGHDMVVDKVEFTSSGLSEESLAT